MSNMSSRRTLALAVTTLLLAASCGSETAAPGSTTTVTPAAPSDTTTTSTAPDLTTTTPDQTTTEPAVSVPAASERGLTFDEHFGYQAVGGSPWPRDGKGNVLRTQDGMWTALKCFHPELNTDVLKSFEQGLTESGLTRELIEEYGLGYIVLQPMLTAGSSTANEEAAHQNCPGVIELFESTPELAGSSLSAGVYERFWRSDEAAAPRQQLEACLSEYPEFPYVGSDTPAQMAGDLPYPQFLRQMIAWMLGNFVELHTPDQNPTDRDAMTQLIQNWVPDHLQTGVVANQTEAHELARSMDIHLGVIYWDCYEPLHHDFVNAERDWTDTHVSAEEIEEAKRIIAIGNETLNEIEARFGDSDT